MNNEDLTQQLLSEFNTSVGNEMSNNDERIENSNDEQIENSNAERLENSNDEPLSTNAAGLFMLTFTWVEGLRAGSRLVWIPDEECLYYTNAISKKYDAMACTCYVNGCTQRIFIMNDGTAGRASRTMNHNHESLYNTYKDRSLFTFMKERCRTAPASAMMIRDIYNEAVLL